MTPPPWVSPRSAAALCLAAVACTAASAKGEASRVVSAVTDLRMAPGAQMRPPLERLRSLPCENPEVCAARDACVTAYDHHVRGLELGRQLRGAVDGGPSTPAEGPELAAKLLEMNVEIEEGQQAMPLCEERIATLRSKFRL